MKLFNNAILFSYLLFLGICYTIYLAPHIAPTTFPYFGFIPIVFPILVLINLIFVLLWLMKNKWIGLLMLVLSLGLFPPLAKTYQYFGKKVIEKPNFKLMTFNVHYFQDSDEFDTFFNKEDADLVLLQELRQNSSQLKELKKEVFADYYEENSTLLQFFSKYPIIEFQEILNEEENAGAAYADIDTGTDTIRVINIYLQPMFIDKDLVKGTLKNMEMAEKNSKILKNKLTTGFIRHQAQIKKILPYIIHSKHPVILAGDLNAVPYSYEYQQFIYWLNDAYFEVGKSSGTSFHDFKYPLRLDYILNTPEILPVSYQVLRNNELSDHYPVIGEFKLP